MYIPQNLALLVFQIFLIFVRIGGVFILIPAFGERYFPRYTRVIIVIAMALILQPLLTSGLPSLPSNPWGAVVYLCTESIIGLFLGLSSRIYFWSLDTLGSLLAMLSGLSAASFFDPNQRSHAPILTTFLSLVATATLFASDAHHLFLHGIVNSYQIFKAGIAFDPADLSSSVLNQFSESFVLAFQISAPFLVVNLAAQLGAGVLSRLMPNLQVFFVLTPLQIIINLAILLMTLHIIIAKVLSYCANF